MVDISSHMNGTVSILMVTMLACVNQQHKTKRVVYKFRLKALVNNVSYSPIDCLVSIWFFTPPRIPYDQYLHNNIVQIMLREVMKPKLESRYRKSRIRKTTSFSLWKMFHTYYVWFQYESPIHAEDNSLAMQQIIKKSLFPSNSPPSYEKKCLGIRAKETTAEISAQSIHINTQNRHLKPPVHILLPNTRIYTSFLQSKQEIHHEAVMFINPSPSPNLLCNPHGQYPAFLNVSQMMVHLHLQVLKEIFEMISWFPPIESLP